MVQVYGGDDYWVIMENLRAYLASEEVQALSDGGRKPLYLGRRPRYSVPGDVADRTVFNSGAAYVLNMRALEKLIALLDGPECLPRRRARNEDVLLARCLQRAGVRPIDTRDSRGRQRFHPFMPSTHLRIRREDEDFPDWH